MHGMCTAALPAAWLATPTPAAVSATRASRQQRVTNTIAFGALGLQLQASGPLRVLSASR